MREREINNSIIYMKNTYRKPAVLGVRINLKLRFGKQSKGLRSQGFIQVQGCIRLREVNIEMCLIHSYMYVSDSF